MIINSFNKEDLIVKYGCNFKNTGNISVQIIFLTNKINNLQKHFLFHKKDHSGKRGLLNMVSKRRKLLAYLKRNFLNIYVNLIEELNLRK